MAKTTEYFNGYMKIKPGNLSVVDDFYHANVDWSRGIDFNGFHYIPNYQSFTVSDLTPPSPPSPEKPKKDISELVAHYYSIRK